MITRPKLSTLVALAAAVCLPAVAVAEPIGIAWRTNLDAAKLEAAQSGRLLLLHFYTQSCHPCRVLDQTVLNQPQVGAAIERDFVPVKVDADAQPALRNWFKITHVPAEVVLTPDGNVVATLSPPDNPDDYIAQAQNLARHVRQSKPGAAGQQAPAVNSAYAGLPVGGAPRTVAPQGQTNQYTAGAPAGGSAAPAAQLAAARPVGSPGAPPTAGFAATGAPSMPANAMPTSYRNPMFAAPPVATGPIAALVAAAPTPGQPMGATPGSPMTSTQAPATAPAASPYASAVPAAGLAATASAPPAQSTAPPIAQTAAPATQFVAAPPQGAAVRPAQPPLPPGSPPVALDGCCPVTLKALKKWTPGSTTYGAVHRGRTYLFLGEQQRHQFMANPDAYSPVFAGYDPVLLLEKQQTVPGVRDYGFDYGGAIYLFSSKETMARFAASPHAYAAGVRLAMSKVDAAAGGTIRR